MKKLFLIALSVLSLNVNAATDEVALEPVTAEASTATYMWVNVNLPSYESELRAINVDIQFPDGFTVGTTVQDFGPGCKWDYEFDEQGTATNWAASGTKKTDNGTYYHFTVYASTSDKPFHGCEGRLIQLKVKTPSAAGVYPVKMLASTYAAKSDKSSENLKWDEAQTSYVVVGTPTDASLKVEGILPSFVTTALNSETAISYLDVSEATVNGTLDPNDMLVVNANSSSYKRAVGADNYATVCLPMAVSGTYYTVKSISSTAITLAEATELPANTPAIVKGDIKASTDSKVTLGTPVAGENGLTGTYETYNLESGAGYYLSKDNAFYSDGASVKPFRAYIDSSKVGAKALNIYLEDATGIHDITSELSADDIYTLQGVRVKNATKGVNIIGGKKVYNK